MMNLTIKTYLFLCLLSFFSILNASEKLPKFGKVDKQHVESTVCPIDSNAHAYYIFNIRQDYFDYNSSSGFTLNMEHHLMIKILDETAFNWADFRIPLYTGGSKSEVAYGLKAYTYNMVNGKIQVTKLDKKQIFREETSENWQEEKFSMPEVKAGSVIEVKYTVVSIYPQYLNEWRVQSTIPILKSYYQAALPEYYVYQQTQRGYLNTHFEQGTENNSIVFKDGSEHRYLDYTYLLTRDNVPAFEVESYLRTPKNYISAVKFELSYTKFPGQLKEYYSNSWEKVTQKLLRSSYFGERLKYTGFIKDEAETLKAKGLSDEELVRAAYQKIQNHYSWNGQQTIFAQHTLRNAYGEGKGDCSEINLTLVGLLRELGLHAYPVVLSTKDRGMLMPTNATLTGLNYVIAGIEIEGVNHYMDATDKYATVDLLPYRCLNYKGRIVEVGNSNWANLMPSYKAISKKAYRLKLGEDGTLEGTVRFADKDYSAYRVRKEIAKCTDFDAYVKKTEERFEGLKIESHSFENVKKIGNELISSYTIKVENAVQDAGGLLLLNPLMFHALAESPFKLEKRAYPVEFDTPATDAITIQLELPKGYVLEETPKPIRMVLPDKSMSYIYSVNAMGNTVVINCMYSRTKCQFLPSEYAALRTFYETKVNKENTSLVIKKQAATASVK